VSASAAVAGAAKPNANKTRKMERLD
jgi:hypothetical protein